MIFSYLILAHLLGDFVLQNSLLVRMKYKGYLGLIIHSSIHAVLIFLVLLPIYLSNIEILLYGSLFIGIIHFFIDYTKVSFTKRSPKKQTTAFIIDQLVHILTLVIAFFILSSKSLIVPNTTFYEIYTNTSLIVFLILLIFLYSVVEVYKYQKINSKDKTAKFKINKQEAHKRVYILTLMYVLYLLISLFLTR